LRRTLFREKKKTPFATDRGRDLKKENSSGEGFPEEKIKKFHTFVQNKENFFNFSKGPHLKPVFGENPEGEV